jgi:hypothetical protein
VLLLVSSQMSWLGHYALVAHHACAEHDSIHHGEAAVAHADSPATDALAWTADEDDPHGHGDCDHFARLPHVAFPALESGCVFLSDDSALLGDPERELAFTLVPLALSPKRGPPNPA